MKLVKLCSLFMAGVLFMSFTGTECKNISLAASQSVGIYSAIKWKTEAVDLGEIPVNKPVTIAFEFTNTSDAAVIVIDAKASCGCTVADYPKQPIAAGKSAIITATYNAATMGAFSKNVTVTIQNEEAKVLGFKGTVI
jgi:hypothetical protein